MSTRSTVDTLTRLSLRGLGITAVAALLVAATAAPASAHGVTGAGGRWYTFIWSGFIHMLAGWDHLLFAGGVVLLAGEIRRAAQMISLFALGHSTTLIVATMAGWQVSATAVDVVIALSLVFVAVVGWIGRPTRWIWFGLSVLGFGLIHGLGLSTRLQDIGLPHDTLPLLARVISFNVGVELGQLVAIGAVWVIGDAVRRYLTWAHTWKATHTSIGAAGLVTAVLLATGIIGAGTATPAQAGPRVIDGCEVRKRTETYPFNDLVGHPPKDFYEPTETIPLAEFGHVLGDNMILVHYRPDLPADQLDALRAFVTGEIGAGVLAGPEPGQTDAFKAVTADETMVCIEFGLTPLSTFTQQRFSQTSH